MKFKVTFPGCCYCFSNLHRFGTLLGFLLLFLISLIVYADDQPTGRLYLNLIWHQHQPSYIDASKNQLIGPWVRAHATKDYFDMAYTLAQYPSVHATINLTPVLLHQLLEYYVLPLSDFVDTRSNTIDVKGFFATHRGKTDPWIDLALKDTRDFDPTDLDYLFNQSGKQMWNCFSVNEIILRRFPEYRALLPWGVNVGSLHGNKSRESYSLQDKIRIKFFFYLVYFDPRFLQGPITMPLSNPDGSPMVVDLSDLVWYDNAGTPDDDSDDCFYLRHDVTEKDCQRLVVEAYKVMVNIIPMHKQLILQPKTMRGQVEIITTPFYHPILPLIYDSDIARVCQPQDRLPRRFKFSQDALYQVARSKYQYVQIFGQNPIGMWPAEGAVSQPVVDIFLDNGLTWIATGPHVLARSLGKSHPDSLTPAELGQPYTSTGSSKLGQLCIFFRDWRLSDEIGFEYPKRTPEENVQAFFKSLEKYRPSAHEPDRIVTVLLDGENAWEWFSKDNDGVRFLNLLYKTLAQKQDEGKIVTVTPAEFIFGNPWRNIPAHPLAQMKSLDSLYPGCWFTPDFSTWIGEDEENKAWNYLLRAREDLQHSGLEIPNPMETENDIQNGEKFWAFKTWDEMFAAEGSDWFWWYGKDQDSGADVVFDTNFRLHLENVYRYAIKAGVNLRVPQFAPIIR